MPLPDALFRCGGITVLHQLRPATTEADITHRKHAIVETTFADLIDGPLAHLPSGLFAANCLRTVVVYGMTSRRCFAPTTAASPYHHRGGDMTTVTELLGNPESVGVWNLVPERSRITFRNKTMWGALKVHGVFTEFSGDGQITDTGRVFGRVDIKAASLNTKLRKRDEDLRGPTFLDVRNTPTSAWSPPARNRKEVTRWT